MATTSYYIPQQLTSVRLARSTNLTGLYYNGTLNNGLGAILSAITVGRLTIDSVSVDEGDRVLLFNQTTPNENGIYVVNQTGIGDTLWELERSADFQSTEQLTAGQYFTVNAGTVLGGNLFVLTDPLPSVIGSGSVGFTFTNVGNSTLSNLYLQKALNLSDVDSAIESYENLGFGSGEVLSLTDADFSGNRYQIQNPPPAFINIVVVDSGNELILPSVDESTSLGLGRGINIINSDSSTENVSLKTSDDVEIYVLPHNSNYTIALIDDGSPEGIWHIQGYVSSFNGQTGDIDFDSIVSFQDAYVGGENAEVLMEDDRPITFHNISTSAGTNAIDVPGTGFSTVGNYRVLGWTFTPNVDIIISALQYEDALIESDLSRNTGIFVKATQELLGSVEISNQDPLDGSGVFRTATLSSPIQCAAGTAYVWATVVPINEHDHQPTTTATPSADIVLSERAQLPASSLGVPLVFPQTFDVVANSVYLGSFEYATYTVDDSVNINDASTNANTIFSVVSTTRASIPAPVMTVAQRNAIASPQVGALVYASNSVPAALYQWNGSAWVSLANPSTNPAFSAYLSATASNVTGDSTLYTVVCDTELFDQGSNFATGIFTAPATGKYWLKFSVFLVEVTFSFTAGYVQIVTSNRTYRDNVCDPGSVSDAGNNLQMQCGFLVDMDAGDTAYPQLVIEGGTKTVDVYGQSGSLIQTSFEGCLVSLS